MNIKSSEADSSMGSVKNKLPTCSTIKYPCERQESTPSRLSKNKNIFEKGFTFNWSDKIYTITEILKTLPPTYKIKDDREEIKGTFYEQELQKTSEETFRIEKVLRWKKQNGERLARVKWVGYDSSYNSWVPETDITNYNGDQ